MPEHSTDQSGLEYIINHVFCPLKLPQASDHTLENDIALSQVVLDAARDFKNQLSSDKHQLWASSFKMLQNLHDSIRFSVMSLEEVQSQINGMDYNDVLVFMIRAQNAAVVMRKLESETLFESFEISPDPAAVMGAKGKLICSYPGPAITVPDTIVNDASFPAELANFLVCMDRDVLEAAATRRKADSIVPEERDTTHPRYITELLTGILRGLGSIADEVPRIRKRIGDDVLWYNAKLPWRRSSLWLVIRVALQTTLERNALGRTTYKSFMLFLMARVTTLAIDHSLSNEILHFMSAKIARRLYKLGTSASPELSQMVVKVTSDVKSILEGRWKSIQDMQQASPPWSPETLSVLQDTQLSLNTSREYICQALLNQHSPSSTASFKPSHRARGTIDDFLDDDGSFLEAAHAAEPSLSLIDFETVVRSGIDDWVACVSFEGINSACVSIEACTSAYSSRALENYEGNPENLSTMLLTLFELWVAMDKLVIRQIPLLAKYPPEVPSTLWNNLLVRKSSALDRLKRLRTYLEARHCQASNHLSVLSSTNNDKSFAVQYFYQSSILQNLKRTIEADAREMREQKLVELRTLNKDYADLQKSAASSSHEFRFNSWGNEYHYRWCNKCDLEQRMRSMTIAVHEWPLPRHEEEAIAVVFELECPVAFDMWRSMTFHVLVDICAPEQILPTPPFIKLPDYSALWSSYGGRHSRLILASDAKPFTACHYHYQHIPTVADRVCVNNGLVLQPFDITTQAWVADSLLCWDSSHLCTFLLPKGPYYDLQQYLAGTSHTSNEVIANQADCHKDMTIHEFIAFGALRSGPLLQWMNILRELRARTLNFRCEEVHLLLAQAVSQVGPRLPDESLLWHEELNSIPFLSALLGELESLMASVEENWLECITINTIIMIVCRVLSSTQEESIKSMGYLLLRRIRTATFTLLGQLSRKMQASNDEKASRDLQGRLRDMAATCRSTFDVDGDPSLLLTANDDIKIFAYCAAMIYDNTPSQLGNLPQHSKLLLERDKRCCHALEAAVRQYVEIHREGLDCAVAEIWDNYRQGTPWKALPAPNSRWLVTQTAPSDSQSPQAVHYNLINGCLLVDGKPLGRLPSIIVQHPTYQAIFGDQVLDIVPADIPGMEYATRGKPYDHQVFFALRDPNNLIILAKHIEQGSHILQLIPSQNFVGDLPTTLIVGHTHWLNLATNEIEIRPVEHAWQSSPENWVLQFAVSGPSTLQNTGGATLVDIRSETWNMISTRMHPLEDSYYIMVTCNKGSGGTHLLKVDLPRYGLEFFINEDGELQSHNMRNMVVDEAQSTGAMLGLVNQLIMRPKSTQITNEHPRTVIIPDGRISYAVDKHHVRVTITTEGARVAYHLYRIDPDLRCLTGLVGLTNKLYQALLHAVTSGCLPDPLTGRTGTEEALHIMHSAACRSFMKLRPRDGDLLREISSLSAMRVWYPTHLQKMQSVSWSCLAPLAQHHGFHPAAKSIMEYGMQLSTFSEGSSDIDLTFDLPPFTNHLLERASIRASAIYPDQFSLPLLLGVTDVAYASRNVPDRNAEERAFHTSFMVHQWPSKLPVQQDILSVFTRWKNVQGVGEPSLSLRYSKSWLRPFHDIFLSAYDRCRVATKEDVFQLVFTLASVSYGLLDEHALVPTLLAFATMPGICTLDDPPEFASYDLSHGFKPSTEKLDTIVSSCVKDFETSEERYLRARDREDERALGRRRHSAFEDRCYSEKVLILVRIQDAWPCKDSPALNTLQVNCYDLNELSKQLRPIYRSCWANHRLKQHLDVLQETLNLFYTTHPPSKLPLQYDLDFHIQDSNVASPASSVDAKYLFARDPPVIHMNGSSHVLPKSNRRDLVSPDTMVTAKLQQLISNFRDRGRNKFRHNYADDLDKSRSTFCKEKLVALPDSAPYTTEILQEYHSLHIRQFQDALASIVQVLSPVSVADDALYNAGLWPRVTPNFLFTRMASASGSCLRMEWRTALVCLSQILLQLQRSRRLFVFAASKNWGEFFKELENEECERVDSELYPDWLLIQIESHFLARPVQMKVAREMMSPSSRGNTSLQLNMGEGKSYVIVPLAASALSDGHRLVRVIVLKSLSAQMFQLLVERLSGLAQRRIFYIPFSRALSIDSSKVQLYRDLMQKCMVTKGILVVQPDHILSFQLMAVDRQLIPRSEAAEDILQTQLWLDTHTRDILDESDEILHVRYQLVYTVGLQRSLQGHPDRWTTTQQVLSLVAKHATRLMNEFPSDSDVSIRPNGMFPSVRVLNLTAGEKLVQWIAQDVINVNGALDNINFDQASLCVKEAVYQFIATESNAYTSLVEERYRHTTVWPSLLVLRGLLACGILVYALKERRWRVDYGLALKRKTMLAVPFRAKDMPSLRAEFGHPDVAVTLTCMSYYYAGLSLQQLMLCFKLLLKQDNPALEYQSWVLQVGLQSVPKSLRDIRGINTESADQLHDLQRLFASNKAVVDFYLSRVVFPKEAKGFPSKLTCSGWDLAQKKNHLTTGFSGTNDNRYLLPSSIVQHDLDYQCSTNARVLAFLLRPENNSYQCIPLGQKVHDFINTLIAQTPEVRVLLDVGAQMLELRNQELAVAWLRASRNAQAAVFVNDDDELVVVGLDGTVEPLVSSPFAQQLDQCVIYLDDAHTRGTDVKLPYGFRAAVTLGPKVTKDRLAQGCMRMRKLGNGQSVMFFAPAEVDRSIRSATQKADSDGIDASDILHWAMLETCNDIEMRTLSWIQQRSDFNARHSAWAQFSHAPTTSISTLETAWLQPEERSLEELYAPCSSPKVDLGLDADIRRRCEEVGILSTPKRSMDEEQEREVTHEVERERQVERPPKVAHAVHNVHAHVRQFVKSGQIAVDSPAFIQVLSSLINTTAVFDEHDQWAHNILVTRDFARTVGTIPGTNKVDDYLRPVNWIVSSNTGHPMLVIMSPNEVNTLLPDIRTSKVVHLCIYTPRTTQTMQACDNLRLYCVPSAPPSTPSESLICQLNLFAAQLYFSDYNMYLHTCSFLGLNAPDLEGEHLIVDNDGFIEMDKRPSARASCMFKRSQLPPLKELFGMRRKGMGYLPTHLGKMLNGRILTPKDFLT